MTPSFRLDRIETALRAFQKAFPEINNRLAIRREVLTDVMRDQILEAYDFLNGLLHKGMDLFTPSGLHNLLELNHIVLCGTDPKTRKDYYVHLSETRDSFTRKIRPIKEWVLAKKKHEDPFKLATGFYSRSLSQPQLFLEGNHRTGNIILNYLLLSRQTAPYIIDAHNALDYLDLSGDIKFTNKESGIESTWMMPGHRRRFRDFLKTQVNWHFAAGVAT